MIRIRIHPLLYAFLFFAAITGKTIDLILVFFSLLAHEMAHILTALGFGYRATAVELFPFGGVAKVDYALFNDPLAEGVTAIAGPIQSLILVVISGLCYNLGGAWLLARKLYYINLGLTLFNCLPLFPLDGGRLLRVWLTTSLGYARSARITTLCTKTVSALSLPLLLFLAWKRVVSYHLPAMMVLLFIAAREENFFYAYWRLHQTKEKRLQAGKTIQTKVWMVERDQPVYAIFPFLSGREYHLFLLINKRLDIIGMLKEGDLFGPCFTGNISTTFSDLWLAKGEKKDIITVSSLKRK